MENFNGINGGIKHEIRRLEIKMILPEVFKKLPPDMVMKSQLDGEEMTASEWAEKLKSG